MIVRDLSTVVGVRDVEFQCQQPTRDLLGTIPAANG
jgi:hypothetical protein